MTGGIVLVAGVVALGAWAVDAVADATRVYVLSQDVAPGTDLTADDILTVAGAHPGTDTCVEVGRLPDGAVSTYSMRKGGLSAAAVVNSGREQELRPVVLTTAPNLPASIKVGDYVDLWIVPRGGMAGRPVAQALAAEQARQGGQGGQGGQGDQSGQAEGIGARRVATGPVIASVGETNRRLIPGPDAGIEVKIPEASLAAILSTVGQEGALVLVPTGQGAPAEKAS